MQHSYAVVVHAAPGSPAPAVEHQVLAPSALSNDPAAEAAYVEAEFARTSNYAPHQFSVRRDPEGDTWNWGVRNAPHEVR